MICKHNNIFLDERINKLKFPRPAYSVGPEEKEGRQNIYLALYVLLQNLDNSQALGSFSGVGFGFVFSRM